MKEEGKKRYLLKCVQVEPVALTECVDGERGSNGSLRWLECKAKLGRSESWDLTGKQELVTKGQVLKRPAVLPLMGI